MYWSLGSNIMEPGLQYIGAHQIFVLQNRLVGLEKNLFIICVDINLNQLVASDEQS